ncbi:DEAD/DEAH box helicase family protein [uncultured Ilyobacter sp.]|uniref:DEAD/DEAH box helicase family protein n=1 Tax=uncultured Ilyobacter sp. TaxID=544433 RepID=UPI0029C035AF|nr:DEAD/DEAH box helicase family protein [uncultured Ilyobacter sp.]
MEKNHFFKEGLKLNSYKFAYRSDEDNLVDDFFIKTLNRSNLYLRASGYFSINFFNVLEKKIYPFIENGGIIRLICGIELSEEDLKEISSGYSLRYLIKNKLINPESEYLFSNLSNICWLIANGRLELKIAVLKNNKNKVAPGIYHEKFSIFGDEYGNRLATIGSSNETLGGYINNFEHIDVYLNWEGVRENQRVKEKIEYFNLLWENSTNTLEVIDFSEDFVKTYKKYSPNEPKEYIENSKEESLKPRPYQQDAINALKNNNWTGILEMATGTGKTLTSIFAARQYIEENLFQGLIIVVCPLQQLIDQWEKDLGKILPDLEIIKCYLSKNNWYDKFNRTLQSIILDKKSAIVLVTINTGITNNFLDNINLFSTIDKIIIVDEVHNIGAKESSKILSIDSKARIGLSATPIRKYDEEGNINILNYFEKIVYKLNLKEAIKRGFLVEYYYHLKFCFLNDEEMEEYKNLTLKIVRALNGKKSSVDFEEKAQILFNKRAKILSTCKSKLMALEDILKELKKESNIHNLLVYTAENPEFFSKTLDVLKANDLIIQKIIGETKNHLRHKIIKYLEERKINGILAMKCLDEGIDIPSADKAILLSSSANEKQFIQRRGRVLRKDKNNRNKVADIYDFLVVPEKIESDTEAKIFERELKRVLEFSLTSLNGAEVFIQLEEYANKNRVLKNFVEIIKEFKS